MFNNEYCTLMWQSSVFTTGHRKCLIVSFSVCFAVWKNQHMRTVTNYFIVNLSFADVLVTLICLPASLVVDITETWFFGNALCKVVPYLQVRDTFWGLPVPNDLACKRFEVTSQDPCFCNSKQFLSQCSCGWKRIKTTLLHPLSCAPCEVRVT